MIRQAILLLGMLLLASCGEEIGTGGRYSSLPARFTCNSVSSMPATLQTALNSPGMWCTVRVLNDGRYEFALPTSRVPEYWNMTGSITDKAYVWVAGLIVGLPNTPEPGADAAIVTCYDLVCPYCYNIPVDRELAITDRGMAYCESCQNEYDPNNQGMLVHGEGRGTRLFRYRVSYLRLSNTLVVGN